MNKYEMIQQAYRWRETKRQESNEELYKQIYYVFFLILAFHHVSFMYKKYDYINTSYNMNYLDLD